MLLPLIGIIGLAAQLASPIDGWLLLDAGRNLEAVDHFALLYEADPRPATARGLAEGLRRECRLREELDRFTERGGPPMDSYADGLAFGVEGQYGPATAAFARAASQSLASGDSLSAATAAVEGAGAALRAGQLSTADSLATLVGEIGLALDRPRLGLAANFWRAAVMNQTGRPTAADSLFSLVADRADSAGLTAITCDAYFGLGSVASRQRRADDARHHYDTALQLAHRLNDRLRRVRILSNLAYAHTQARDTRAARLVLAEAFALADSCSFDSMRGYLHTDLAATLEVGGDRDGAVEHFKLSVEAFVRQGHESGELGARQRLAYNQMMSGHFAEAITNYDICLEIIERRDSPLVLNWVFAGLALTYHKLGDLDQAEIYYRRAMAQNEALGDRMSVAFCYLSLGWLDSLRGNFGQALAHHHTALAISREIDDPEGVGEAHAALADLQFRLGNWEETLEQYDLAMDIARQHNREELLRATVSGLAALGTATGRPDVARGYCETALDIARRWRDRSALIWALTELAEQNLAVGDPTAAQTHLAEADSLLQPEGQYVLRSRILRLTAHCVAHPAAALALADEAVAAGQDGGLPEQEWVCLSDRGLWRLALGDTAGALTDQAAAVHIVESLRRNVGHDELRRHMLRPALLPYERAVDLLAGSRESDGALRAFAFAERSRAQILGGRLRVAVAGFDQGATVVTERERDILAEIVYHQSRLQEATLSAEDRALARRRVSELETEYAVSRLNNDQVVPEPGILATVPPRPRDLAAIPRPDERVAAFFLGTEHSWLFEIFGGAVQAHRLPPRHEIEGPVRRYLALREAPDTPAELVAKAARKLSDLIFGSLTETPEASVLIVIPDALLHHLPFAALPHADGPLGVRYQLFTAPSLQTLDYLRRRENRKRQDESENSAVVTLGHGGVPGHERLHPYAGRPFMTLNHATDEARDVADLFPGALCLTGKDATESALAAASIGLPGILHLAVHGDVDDREVRRSFLLLEQDDPAGGDGLLQWDEVANLDLGSSLVTLAACRSARGVLAVGEGVTGLTQAFLFAGAGCVLAAQADISDAFSRRFMLDFYGHLRDGDTAAAALQKGQQAAAAADLSGRARWADFVLVGDGTVTLPPDLLRGGDSAAGPGKRTLMGFILAVGALIALALAWFARHRH